VVAAAAAELTEVVTGCANWLAVEGVSLKGRAAIETKRVRAQKGLGRGTQLRKPPAAVAAAAAAGLNKSAPAATVPRGVRGAAAAVVARPALEGGAWGSLETQ